MPGPFRNNGGDGTTLWGGSDAERRLRLYETIVSATPDLIYVFDLDHRFVYANEALLEVWGKTWDEAIGRNCLELGYEPWHAEMHDREIEQVKATGRPIRGEVPFNGTNGRRIYDYIFTPVFGTDGKVEAVAGTTRDVTERKEAEEAAARLHEQNREILDSITDAFFALDREFKFTYLNHQAEIVLSHEPGALLGRSIWEAYPGLAGSEFELKYRLAMDDGVASKFTSYYPDHERWYQVNVYPSPAGITAYFRNVTEERIAEEQLRESERLIEQHARIFNITLTSITDFAYIFDREGRFTYANRALTDLLQIKPEEIVGKTFFDLPYPHELAVKLAQQIEHVFATGEVVRDETLYTDPSGRSGHYEYIFNPVFNSDNKVETVAGSTRDVTERVQAAAVLAESEERYRSIVDQTVAGVSETDLDGRFKTVNDHLCHVLGYSREEMLNGQTIASVTHPDDLAETTRMFKKLVATGESFNLEKRYIRKDGTVVWADAFVSPIRNASGAIVAVAAVVNDISSRRSVEQELRAAIEFDNAVMDNMGEGLYTVDTQGNLITMNRAAERLFGRRLDECRGMNMHALMHYMHRDGSPYSVEECERRGPLAATVITNSQDVFVRSDGTFFDTVYTAAPLVTAGEVTGTVVVFRDATDEIRSSNLLHESENRFRLMADNSPTLVWMCDTEVRGTYFNRTWLDYTGRTLDEEIGDGWRVDVHPDDVDHLLEVFQGSLSRRTPFEFEYRLRRHDGVYRWMLSRGMPLIPADGDFLGYVGSCTDIDDIKRVESQLRESEERIRIAVDAARLVTWEWDLELDLVYWTDRSLSVMGETTLSNPSSAAEFFQVLHVDDVEAVRTRIFSLAKEGEAIDLEFRTKRLDGSYRWISAYGQIIRTEGGRPVTLSGVAADITERKLAERALQRYRLLSERSRDAIWFLDTEGNFKDINEAAVGNYGYTREEFLAMNVADIRQPDTVADVPGQLKKAETQGVSFETVHVRKDGTEFPVDVTATAADFGGERLIMAIVRDISERKAAEDALRRSEERSQLAQAAGRVGVWDWDSEAGRTYWSTSMWTIYGEDPSELDPDEKYWSSHLHPADRERVVLHLRDARETGAESFYDEFRIIKKDGSVGWIESNGTIVRDHAGKAVRMYGVNIEITERKDAQDRVRLSENQLRLITNALPALIAYVDTSRRYRYANSRFDDWFGLPAEEVVGKTVRDVFGRSAYAIIEPWIDKALAGEKCTFETFLTYKSRGQRYVNISYVPDIGVEGEVHGYYTLTHDLTDLKRSQDLLRTSEARLGLMMESLTDYAIISLDRDGRIDSWNLGAELIFGFSRDEALKLKSDVLFTPEDRAAGIPALEMKNAREKGKAIDERWHIRKDGTRFYASGVMIPLYVGDVLTGYAKIATDLTERRRHAEELQRAHDELEHRVHERTRELAQANTALLAEMEVREESERQRADLLGRLVTGQEVERRRIARDLHDQLGQRLTALRLKIESLRGISTPYPEIASRVDRLQQISEQLDSEVSFLAWELRPTALDDLGLEDAIRAFVGEWSRHFDISGEFHSNGLSQAGIGHDVETHLYRITQEALNNIVKHAEAANVTVLLEKRGTNVMLIIEDDGIGFDSSDDSVTAGSSGGLGLVGMRERALLVNGTVEIETARGKGTTIFVRIPIG